MVCRHARFGTNKFRTESEYRRYNDNKKAEEAERSLKLRTMMP